jgi:hypothetical protein
MTEGRDREIDLRRIALFGVGLVATVVAAALAMWLLIVRLRSAGSQADPAPSPLPEARLPAEPPGPRLQTDPAGEMAALRAEERELLEGWGWVDRQAGVARVPVEVGMDLLLARQNAAPATAAPEGPTP